MAKKYPWPWPDSNDPIDEDDCYRNRHKQSAFYRNEIARAATSLPAPQGPVERTDPPAEFTILPIGKAKRKNKKD